LLKYYDIALNWLELNPPMLKIVQVLLVIILAYFSFIITRRIILKVIRSLVKRSKNNWDDILLENHVFDRLAHLVPALLIKYFAFLLPDAEKLIGRLDIIYVTFVLVLVSTAFLNALVEIYNNYDSSKNRPIKGYIQTVKIVIVIVGFLISISILLDRSPFVILSGVGAMTAVILLIFRDTILSLVASIQLTYNDMIRIGDWITMPKYNADGDVIDIALHTVKVQNWDKTIVNIPTYKLIDESFQNWRGMYEAGGRRIARAVKLDMGSVKFLDEQLLEKLKKVDLLKSYLAKMENEVREYNEKFQPDLSVKVNGSRLTNLGTLRAYIHSYLINHPKIHQGHSIMVRQLPPSENGLPLQIYAFANDLVWENYEVIQADIFDHIIAIIPEFELKIFQSPSGADFKEIGKSAAK